MSETRGWVCGDGRMRKAWFACDGVPGGPYEGWHMGSTMDGHNCPYFELPVAAKIVEAVGGRMEIPERVLTDYAAVEGSFAEWRMTKFISEGDVELTVYPVGHSIWPWKEVQRAVAQSQA
jgi:hypothetical protein